VLANIRHWVSSQLLWLLTVTVPYVVTLWYHAKYAKTRPMTEAEVAIWRGRLSSVDDDDRREALIVGISEIYDSEKERQTRLEDKLNGQANLLGVVYPITAVVIALAVSDKQPIPFAFSAIAIVYLTLGFAAARFGVSSSVRFEPQVEDVEAAMDGVGEPAVALAAVKAASVVANRPRSTRTNNWIWCCQVSLLWAVVLTAAAAILLLPGHLPTA
jgi:hypothetical protein